MQHTPERAGLLEPLLSALAAFSPVVVVDPEPLMHKSPWRTYRACLEAAPDWATHHLVVQDDIQLCDGFAETLPHVIDACWCRLVCLCVCGEPSESSRHVLDAWHIGRRWAQMDVSRWLPALCNVWPTGWIADGLAWVDQQDWPEAFNADDEIIGRMLREHGWPASATVPSLAHHDDMAESYAGQKAAFGANYARVTAVWDPGFDVRRTDWSAA